jgi:sec-independent protein translocase protein TatA
MYLHCTNNKLRANTIYSYFITKIPAIFSLIKRIEVFNSQYLLFVTYHSRKMNRIALLVACLLTTITTTVHSFIPVQNKLVTPSNGIGINTLLSTNSMAPIVSKPSLILDRQQRHSVANVQMMGLFGLGAPEIAVILVAAAFLLGPQKLAELGKDAGKIAGELKEVPKEFQAGLKEGEQAAQLAKQQPQQPSIPEAAIEEKKE